MHPLHLWLDVSDLWQHPDCIVVLEILLLHGVVLHGGQLDLRVVYAVDDLLEDLELEDHVRAVHHLLNLAVDLAQELLRNLVGGSPAFEFANYVLLIIYCLVHVHIEVNHLRGEALHDFEELFFDADLLHAQSTGEIVDPLEEKIWVVDLGRLGLQGFYEVGEGMGVFRGDRGSAAEDV